MKIGDRFNRLVVSKLLPGSSKVHYKAIVNCDCGTKKTVRRSDLVTQKTQSCGCLSKEKCIQRSTKHGHGGRDNHSQTYNSWAGMLQRCYYKGHAKFKYYGGRGIRVCKRWRNSFENFLVDMGVRPSNKTLDRKNNNGNYTPLNCKWSTHSAQMLNRRGWVHV